MLLCNPPRNAPRRDDSSRGQGGFHGSFCLGVAIAALIWAALGVGTTVSLSTSVMAEPPALTIAR